MTGIVGSNRGVYLRRLDGARRTFCPKVKTTCLKKTDCDLGYHPVVGTTGSKLFTPRPAWAGRRYGL